MGISDIIEAETTGIPIDVEKAFRERDWERTGRKRQMIDINNMSSKALVKEQYKNTDNLKLGRIGD